MANIKLPAKVESIDELTAFVDEQLEALDCPMKVQMQIDIAIDEIFSNIAFYAYEGKEGEAIVDVDKLEEGYGISLTFTDEGVPYNPLEKDDPDTTLSAEERKIGGLGIFMVKKTMTDMKYEYKDGKNILTVTKVF